MSAKFENRVSVNVTNGDCIVPNKNDSKTSITGTYFICSGENNYAPFKSYFEEGNRYRLSSKKIELYKKLFMEMYGDRAGRYPGKMHAFVEKCDYLIGLNNPSVQIGLRPQTDERHFIQFINNEEPITSAFRHLLYADLSKIVFEKKKDFIEVYPVVCDDEVFSSNDEDDVDKIEEDSVNETRQNNFIPEQIIYYGVPGCGKSFAIEKKIEDKPKDSCPRIVFHPEYTNTDFVGQILPVVNANGKISYEFIPGPFTKILLKACINLNNPYCLVIEEINRGSAAAIFGDVFQLLDRDRDHWSKYPVNNRDILKYIEKISNDDEGYYADSLTKDEAIKVKEIFDRKGGICLPPNLSILATMNTSDQNVFTLDNAFQRRFDMKLIKNDFENDADSKKQKDSEILRKDLPIENLNVKWEVFQKAVNALISKVSEDRGLSSMEDKRIGCWFVKNIDGKIPAENFANKVLKYMWDDAFKFDREKAFDKNFKSLEDLVTTYESSGIQVFSTELQRNMGLKSEDAELSA